jgi:hypothetical protein
MGQGQIRRGEGRRAPNWHYAQRDDEALLGVSRVTVA